jgi:hypothetical protein
MTTSHAWLGTLSGPFIQRTAHAFGQSQMGTLRRSIANLPRGLIIGPRDGGSLSATSMPGRDFGSMHLSSRVFFRRS